MLLLVVREGFVDVGDFKCHNYPCYPILVRLLQVCIDRVFFYLIFIFWEMYKEVGGSSLTCKCCCENEIKKVLFVRKINMK